METVWPARAPQDAEGWAVIDAGLRRATATFASRLDAAFAIGSLAHGGFSTSSSDVDLALILADLAPEDAGRMQRVAAAVAGDLVSPLAGRLSIFWSSWEALAAGERAGRFPLADLVDLAHSGIALQGEDRRGGIRLPAGGALGDALVLEGAAFMHAKLISARRIAVLRSPPDLMDLGCREVTKAVMFPARFLFTLVAGRPAATEEAALYMVRTGAPHVRALVEAAYHARLTGGFDRERMGAALGAGLRPLYGDLTTRYAERLDMLGEHRLAAVMLRWRSELEAG